jgi:hypothetical protein
MVLIENSSIGSDRMKITILYSETSEPNESKISHIVRLLHMKYIFSLLIKYFSDMFPIVVS